MPQKQGHLVGKMLWLVPRYVEKPGSLMKLGSILKDAENLESSLNLEAIPEIPTNSRRDASAHVRNHVHTELSNQDSLLTKAMPNPPYFNVGAEAELKWTQDAQATVNAMDVKAEVFIPSDEFMKKALEYEPIIKYAKGCAFTKSLYVIVGVATACRLSINEKQDYQHTLAGSANVSLPGGAGELRQWD